MGFILMGNLMDDLRINLMIRIEFPINALRLELFVLKKYFVRASILLYFKDGSHLKRPSSLRQKEQ